MNMRQRRALAYLLVYGVLLILFINCALTCAVVYAVTNNCDFVWGGVICIVSALLYGALFVAQVDRLEGEA